VHHLELFFKGELVIDGLIVEKVLKKYKKYAKI